MGHSRPASRRPQIFTGIAIHKSAEPNSLIVYVDTVTPREK